MRCAVRARRRLVPALAAALIGLLAPLAQAQEPFVAADATHVVAVPGTALIAIAVGEAGVHIARNDLTHRGTVAGLTGVLSVDADPNGVVWAALPDARQVVSLDPRTRTVKKRY